ncbi:MAG: hypothetical protein AB7V22_10070 [Kiritimatiellia bacterium]
MERALAERKRAGKRFDGEHEGGGPDKIPALLYPLIHAWYGLP